MADFEQAIPKLLAKEGGSKYTDIPEDKGGPTKWGISQRAYPKLNIRHVTRDQAVEIYRRDYWERISGDDIASQRIAEALFEAAVVSGPRTAAKQAQEIAAVAIDGDIGPITLKALNVAEEGCFLALFKLRRVAFYAAIVMRRREQGKFLLGWINRELGGT